MSPSVRPPVLVAVVVAALTVGGGLALLLGTRGSDSPSSTVAAPAGPEPGVTIGRTDGLTDDDVVIVRGAGLPEGLEIVVAPCGRESLEAGRFGSCDLDVAARTTTDDTGAFSVGYRVARDIRVIGEDVDCALDACVLSVIRSGANLVEVARAPLSFVPDDAPRPRVTAVPRSDLSAQASVTVRATGFDERVTVRQCVTGRGVAGSGDRWCDPATARVATTADGTLDLVTTVLRVLVGPGGAPLDCLAAATTCELEVADDEGSVASVGLWFDPDAAAPPAPAMLAAPTQGLGDRDDVRLAVAGLLAAPYELALCPRNPFTGVACEPVGTGTIQGPVRSAGLTVAPPRRIGDGAASFDCAVAPGCELRLTGPHPVDASGVVLAVPIGFDPDRPLLLPLVAVAADGTRTAVRAVVAGDDAPTLHLCPAGSAPADGSCRAVGPPDRLDDGTWAWRVRVPASLGGAPCPDACDVVVSADAAYPLVRAPLRVPDPADAGEDTPHPT